MCMRLQIGGIIGLLFLGLLGLQRCPTQPADPPEPGLLSLQYTTCTEVWLRVLTPDTARQVGLRVYRDTTAIADWTIPPGDTLIEDTGLRPNTTYTYHTVRVQDGRERATSPPLNVTTLDTTSNAFSWTIDTLGNPQYGSSALRDVAIIDQDNIWAVGEIYLPDPDSSWDGTGGEGFNAVHWNGTRWQPLHIPAVTAWGSQTRGPINTVFVTPEQDVWMFSDAGSYAKWDGFSWESAYVPQRQGSIRAMWGSSSNNLYFVGTNGTIVHYDGATFTRVASGTELDFTDIWGAKDPSKILAVANDQNYTTLQTILVQIEDSAVRSVALVPLTYPLSTVWFLPNRHYYVGGSGLYEKERLSDEFWANNLYSITRYYVTRIRGTALNDVWAVGAYGEVLHWNGLRWHSFRSATGLGNGAYTALAVDRNTVIAVGGNAGYAVTLRGRRE